MIQLGQEVKESQAEKISAGEGVKEFDMVRLV
jgi:hypothetical protein